ncbi:DUF3108 domain-containing protein [Rhodoblastus sp.]|uniref:DUF3108 domain-containing protein n=1 Tax=Rhodoblastus sp. TaxID=1962975 RepID=UPI00260CFDA6|nr:DUF3108 domain-containing protein [Rhodoblastus sp.]
MKGFASRSFALVAGALAVAAPAGAARAENMHANYRVSLIGVPIGVAIASASVAESHYKVALNVRLTGVAAMISNLRMALASSGDYQRGAISPAGYATIASNSRETRTLRMAMSEGAVRQVQYSPPWDDSRNPERVPLTEASKRDIIDPLSAFIMPVPEGASTVGPAACNRRVPVFDGYTRFDVALDYVGVKEIKTSGYSGPVTVCSARYIPIAGHKPSNKATQFMAENKDMDIWLAPAPNLRLVVPYRVSLMTMAGTAVIEASELRFSP